MSIKRQIERNNLKKQSNELESRVRALLRINDNLQRINDKMNKNMEELFKELKLAKDIITAMAISDIRNHNYTTNENKKVILIPFSFLSEVTKKYTVKIVATSDDILTIEPVELREEVSEGVVVDEEGVTNDEAKQ
jgi:HD superfamily phosphohydrolase